MEDYEKLGTFYLGAPYDLRKKETAKGLLLYDSKDLVTHAVCVGMTGSGKTGLCLALLEEAALDGIPAILIDPKGDLPNLLLTFPELRPQDFLPWVNEEEARKKGLSTEDYAAQQAELWKRGLADWHQGGDRIRRLREAAEFVVYTPGSTAGLPVSILKSFAAPEPAVLEDAELLQSRIGTTATGLLGLVGLDADPVKSRDHILISSILGWAWGQGIDLTLESLIQHVQNPPMPKIGVLDLESFYPTKDRFGLVMAINNLLAAPGFALWLEGEPLDVGAMLHTRGGKPRHCIFSIAHLNDAERMFFVSLLLTQVIGWMQSQTGTNSLRAILYMDEIFGFFPPVANPPSKAPLLRLVKQARAFGLGIVLATQNPVDLDYKALSNAGTWLIGRLQTERDKDRVLEGLEGAAAASSVSFNRKEMEETLAGLGQRVFLMNNVHEDEPVVFQTRWAMSYLRGPMTGQQIKALMDPMKKGAAKPSPRKTATRRVAAAAASAEEAAPLGPEIAQFYAPLSGDPGEGGLTYHPHLVGVARVNYSDAKISLNATQEICVLTPVSDEAIPVRWEEASEAGFSASALEKSAPRGAKFTPLPAAASKPRSYTTWEKDFVSWVYGSQRLALWRSPSLKQVSRPGESERDFRIRLQQAARERRDEAVEKLRQKYSERTATLQERLRRARQAVERETDQVRQQKAQTAISFGATLLGAFVGRRAVSATTLGRATTAARGVSRSMKEQEDVGRAQDTVESLEQRLAALEEEFSAEAATLEGKIDPQAEELESITLQPKKTGISVQLVALTWAPQHSAPGGETQASR